MLSRPFEKAGDQGLDLDTKVLGPRPRPWLNNASALELRDLRRNITTLNVSAFGVMLEERFILTTSYNTIRDAILTCAHKLTLVSLIYYAEPETKKVEKRNKVKSKKRIRSEVSVNIDRSSSLCVFY